MATLCRAIASESLARRPLAFTLHPTYGLEKVRGLLEHFSAVSAPRLESLEIFSMDIGDTIPPQLIEGALMLSKVYLETDTNSELEVSLDSIASFPATITSLSVVNGSFSSRDHFHRFMLTMPNLTNLSLLGIEVQPSFTHTHITTPLPSLVDLVITEKLNCLFNLAIPSLRHLDVSVPLDELHLFATWLSTVTSGCGSPYPAVRWLDFHFGDDSKYYEESAIEVKGLCHGFPNVTHVSIQDVNITPLMCLCDDTAWPHLDTLTIRDLDYTKEGLIMSTLYSVVTARPAIRHLRLATTVDCNGPQRKKIGANQNRTAARTHACGGIEYLCVLRNHLGYFGNTLAESRADSKQFVRNIWVQKLVGSENGAGGSKNHYAVLYKTRQTEAYLDIM